MNIVSTFCFCRARNALPIVGATIIACHTAVLTIVLLCVAKEDNLSLVRSGMLLLTTPFVLGVMGITHWIWIQCLDSRDHSIRRDMMLMWQIAVPMIIALHCLLGGFLLL